MLGFSACKSKRWHTYLHVVPDLSFSVRQERLGAHHREHSDSAPLRADKNVYATGQKADVKAVKLVVSKVGMSVIRGNNPGEHFMQYQRVSQKFHLCVEGAWRAQPEVTGTDHIMLRVSPVLDAPGSVARNTLPLNLSLNLSFLPGLEVGIDRAAKVASDLCQRPYCICMVTEHMFARS